MKNWPSSFLVSTIMTTCFWPAAESEESLLTSIFRLLLFLESIFYYDVLFSFAVFYSPIKVCYVYFCWFNLSCSITWSKYKSSVSSLKSSSPMSLLISFIIWSKFSIRSCYCCDDMPLSDLSVSRLSSFKLWKSIKFIPICTATSTGTKFSPWVKQSSWSEGSVVNLSCSFVLFCYLSKICFLMF